MQCAAGREAVAGSSRATRGKWLRVVATLLLLLPLPAAAGDSVFGDWIPPDRDAVIRIQQTPGGARVRLLRLLAGPTVDTENADPALRRRPLEGVVLGEGFRRDGAWWTGGELYDPSDGETYRARFRVDGDEHLEVRGYVGAPLFGRSQRWLRKSRFEERVLRMLDAPRCRSDAERRP